LANYGLDNFGIVYFASVLNRIRYQGATALLESYVSPRVLESWGIVVQDIVAHERNLISHNCTLISIDGSVTEINSDFFQRVPITGFTYSFFYENPESPDVVTFTVAEIEHFPDYDNSCFFGAEAFYRDYANQLVVCEGIFLELVDPNLSLTSWSFGHVTTSQFIDIELNQNKERKRDGLIRDYLDESGFTAEVCRYFAIDPIEAMKMHAGHVIDYLFEVFDVIENGHPYGVSPQRDWDPLIDWPRDDHFREYRKK
jgi:hypothetical protein